MKTVYLVRHGETISNIKKLWQDGSDVLSPSGFLQADILASRIKNLTVDKAITSTLTRAVQTAERITKQTGLTFMESAFFAEATVPTSTVGYAYENDENNPVFKFFAARDAHTDNPDFRYEDEETYNEFIDRIKAGLVYLESLPVENILVVTHGTILRTLISCIMHQDMGMTPLILFKAGWNLETVNASISVIRKKEYKPWTILTFNDHAHFAE
jgi:alpha-ribazole phosphatase